MPCKTCRAPVKDWQAIQGQVVQNINLTQPCSQDNGFLDILCRLLSHTLPGPIACVKVICRRQEVHAHSAQEASGAVLVADGHK